MKLVVPFIREVRAEDLRLIRLAEFLGIECEQLAIPDDVGEGINFLHNARPHSDGCLVLNPEVIQQWTGDNCALPQLALLLRQSFRYLLVHAVRDEAFDSRLIAVLTGGQVLGVQAIGKSGVPYKIASDSGDVCEAFAGLSFGQADADNDRVFPIKEGSRARKLILVNGEALLAIAKQDDSEVLFIGSKGVLDLCTKTDGEFSLEYFSRLLPQAMALRYVFGDRCWRPAERHASVIVDDPLLRKNYGFLNFDRLLGMMNQHNFHTTIAFIPYNFRRSSPRIARMFCENSSRLSICFHGNDHMEAEFAVAGTASLGKIVHVAESRMEAHEAFTRVPCQRVMVFPQGKFSIDAMEVLKSRNFAAAINTSPLPWREEAILSIRDIAQPAILRYAGFPLFHRRYSKRTEEFDIAFDLFFGKPVFIVEHHDVFQNPTPLLEAVARVNRVAPEIQWSNVGAAVRRSVLQRRESGGSYYVQAYSRSVQVSNRSANSRRLIIEWHDPSQDNSIDKVLRNGLPYGQSLINQTGARVDVCLEAGDSENFSLLHRSSATTVSKPSLRHSARVFFRRRLSEARDNYLSHNPMLLATATKLRRRLKG